MHSVGCQPVSVQLTALKASPATGLRQLRESSVTHADYYGIRTPLFGCCGARGDVEVVGNGKDHPTV